MTHIGATEDAASGVWRLPGALFQFLAGPNRTKPVRRSRYACARDRPAGRLG